MSPSSVYDLRYSGDYREHLTGNEMARWKALDHFLTHVLKLGSAKTVLDYGAGSGLFVNLWEKTFAEAELFFCDTSSVAKEKFSLKYPRYADHYYLIHEHQWDRCHDTFDVVVSVEVLEHVKDLDVYLTDISRLLKPGGYFVWTTPCANRFSIEHVFNAITGKIERTKEGFRRWTWEDPTHLRRLRSSEIESILRKKDFSPVRFRFSAHLFSFVCTYFPLRRAQRFRNRLIPLDYSLFRCLPNGASMIGGARKAP